MLNIQNRIHTIGSLILVYNLQMGKRKERNIARATYTRTHTNTHTNTLQDAVDLWHPGWRFVSVKGIVHCVPFCPVLASSSITRSGPSPEPTSRLSLAARRSPRVWNTDLVRQFSAVLRRQRRAAKRHEKRRRRADDTTALRPHKPIARCHLAAGTRTWNATMSNRLCDHALASPFVAVAPSTFTSGALQWSGNRRNRQAYSLT